jgi:hypothetical protein
VGLYVVGSGCTDDQECIFFSLTLLCPQYLLLFQTDECWLGCVL